MAHQHNKLVTAAKNLKAKGHTAREIAELLGLSRSYTFELLSHDANAADGSAIVLAAVDSLREELKEATDTLIEELENVKKKLEAKAEIETKPFTQEDLEKALHHYLARNYRVGNDDDC